MTKARKQKEDLQPSTGWGRMLSKLKVGDEVFLEGLGRCKLVASEQKLPGRKQRKEKMEDESQ